MSGNALFEQALIEAYENADASAAAALSFQASQAYAAEGDNASAAFAQSFSELMSENVNEEASTASE